MAGKKKPAKIPAMEYPAVSFCKCDRDPDELREWEAKNRELMRQAIVCATYTIKPYAAVFKGNTVEGRVYSQGGKFWHVPKDAPKSVQLAEQFLKAVGSLDSATGDGDVKFVKECAMQVAAMAIKVVVETTRRKSLSAILKKHDASIHGSSTGGSRSPVWEPVAELAPELFATFKRAGLNDTAAVARTRTAFIKLKQEGKFDGKVPGMTCLRGHLVDEPSSGK